jgi:hypothetical protein
VRQLRQAASQHGLELRDVAPISKRVVQRLSRVALPEAQTAKGLKGARSDGRYGRCRASAIRCPVGVKEGKSGLCVAAHDERPLVSGSVVSPAQGHQVLRVVTAAF